MRETISSVSVEINFNLDSATFPNSRNWREKKYESRRRLSARLKK